MVRNKLLILISSIVIGTSLFSEEKTQSVIQEQKIDFEKKLSYIRLDYGLPYLFSLNLGKRLQINHHGLDISAGTVLYIHNIYGIRARIGYMFYPKPNLEAQYYLGVGLNSILDVFKIHYTFRYQPEVVFGKEYIKKNGRNRFVEIRIGYFTTSRRSALPIGFRRADGTYRHCRYVDEHIQKWPSFYLCHGIQF